MWATIALAGGVVLFGAAVAAGVVALLDRREARRSRRFATPEAFWDSYLTRPPVTLDHRLGREFVRRTGVAHFCTSCFAPFSGPAAPLMRPVGHGPSPANSSLCRRCSAHVPLGGAEVEITVLFADLRGSTGLAEQLSASAFSDLLNRFYASAVPILVRHDALVDKLAGDQVMALFVPAFAGDDHARLAVEAAAEVLRSAPPGSDVGVGVHTGVAFVGVVGVPGGVTDFTAVGDTVNVAARLAAEAGAGELLYTTTTAARLPATEPPEAAPHVVTVRGRRENVAVHSLQPEGRARPADRKRIRRRESSQPNFGWRSLTATERDVAGLVAEGLTNRDVARRLLMSPYTVDTHLRHVFAKLRLRSRVALAAEVAQQRAGQAATPP